jgi:hypothetical protein
MGAASPRTDRRRTGGRLLGRVQCFADGVGKPVNTSPIFGVVGAFYLVPCIFVPFGFYGIKWVPVIGTEHRDAELGADWDHWHVDWRFVPDKTLRQAESPLVNNSPHGKVISNTSADRGRHELTRAPELKRRLCRRTMPEHPAKPRPAWAAMEEGQRSRCNKLKDGHICPHRGIDLRPFAKEDGTAICPGHGLHWNLRTGELLARHSTTEHAT